MSATDLFIQKIHSLQSEFEALEKQWTAMENRHKQEITRINDLRRKTYQSIDDKRKKGIADISNQVDVTTKQIDAYLLSIDYADEQLPPKIKKKGKVDRSSVIPSEVDFSRLSQMVPKILDPTLWAMVKRTIKVDGYSSRTEMVCAYMRQLEQGRQYIEEKRRELTVYRDQNMRTIDATHKQERQSASQKAIKQEQNAKQKYEQEKKRIEGEISSLINSGKIVSLCTNLKRKYDSLGARKENWTKYVMQKNTPDEIMIGSLKIPLHIPLLIRDSVSPLLAPFYNDGDITIPYTVDFSTPISFLVKYAKKDKAQVVSGFQSIIFRIIRSMPANSFNITFIDPIDRGTNLGRLQRLVDLYEKPAASRADITAQLRTLETLVDEMSLKLATIGSIYDHNRIADAKMEYNIVVIHDFPEGFDRNSLESLNVLVNNARKCGISIILSVDKDVQMEAPMVDFINKISQHFITVDDEIIPFTITHAKFRYMFAFSNSLMVSDEFIEQVKRSYEQGQVIDNSFGRFYDLSRRIQYRDSTEKLMIPFALDRGNNIVEIELGGASTAHSMISGSIGSGKSTTLHALITGIIMNYHPDDVELWLVDYKKVEFAEYCLNTPPHVKLIGLDKSEEFTFSLLEQLKTEFENRMQLFAREHVQDIRMYRKIPGVKPIPRIVLIIDEFHNLTQTIQNEPYYMTLFENALLEYRALGLSCILSDQAISDGLRGLTEKGRKQIHNRIAMKNILQEVKDTLSIDNSYYTDALLNKIRTLSTGDLIFKKEFDNGTGNMQIVIDKYKSLYITQSDRNAMMPFINDNLGKTFLPKELIVVDGKKRKGFDQKEITKYEMKNPDVSSNLTHLYIGTPSSLDSCFRISLASKMDSNILLIGSDDEMRMSILLCIVRCIIRDQSSRVIIITDPTDELYEKYEHYWNRLKSPNAEILTDFSKICKKISDVRDNIMAGNKQNVFFVVLGFDILYEDMKLASPKKQNSHIPQPASPPMDNVAAGLDAMIQRINFAQAKYDDQQSNQDKADNVQSVQQTNTAYDARDDFNDIIVRGTRHGYHTIMTFSSAKCLRRIREIKPESFEHKIAFKMSMEDSMTYLGNSKYASTLDDISAVYYDSGSSIKTFRPYLLPII